MKKYCFLVILLMLVPACSNEEQANTPSPSLVTEAMAETSSTKVNAAELSSYKLIIFVNPNGGPCKIQDSIIAEMSEELRGKVVVQYMQTTIPSDLDTFHHYGIRALPTLLLADATGKEVKRLTPGIKSAIDIRALIQSISQS